MLKNLIRTLAITLLVVSCRGKNVIPDVIPLPNTADTYSSKTNISHIDKIIYHEPILSSDAQYLKAALADKGYKMAISSEGKQNAWTINLSIDETLTDEGYVLKTGRNSVSITGGRDGVFYGIQTFLQELNNGAVRRGVIEDAPRYGWRGFMLDEARHFFGKETVKQLLDIMSYYKLNKFHWHLTDAQGWRIEIKAYPKLTEIGGIGTHSDPDTPAQFYTQDDIREIVAYAASRHIEIIPEIDMPGHASAANRAYPEYNGGGTPQFADFTFNVGKEGTYTYLTNILREVADLFPSKYIHIGGDEVFYGSDAWNRDPYVQSLMRRHGLKTIKDAEGYFINRMTDSLKMLGKKVIAWDDVLDFKLDKEENIICWWRHDRPQSLRKSLDEGYKTILCPRKPMYYDFIQDASHKCGRIWDGFCPLEDVYAFPDAWYEQWKLSESEMSDVLGIQSNLWTELVHNRYRFDFMIFPRLCALAEAAWTTPENKDYGDFSLRMESAYAMFDAMGIYYYDPRDPKHHTEPEGPVIKKRGESSKPKMDYRD